MILRLWKLYLLYCYTINHIMDNLTSALADIPCTCGEGDGIERTQQTLRLSLIRLIGVIRTENTVIIRQVTPRSTGNYRHGYRIEGKNFKGIHSGVIDCHPETA